MGIGLFAPLPLAVMVPFMAFQSLAMGEAFGKGFQYGKRKISAMSNDEFNKINMVSIMREIQIDYENSLPAFTQSVQQSTKFQSIVLRELGDVIKSLPSEVKEFFTGGFPENTIPPPVSSPVGVDPIMKALITGLIEVFKNGISLNILGALTPPAGAVPFTPAQIPRAELPSESNPVVFPPEDVSEAALLAKYANWQTYRQKGGILQEQQWRLARRGQEGGLAEIKLPNTIEQGKLYHPAYFTQLKSIQNNLRAHVKGREVFQKQLDGFIEQLKKAYKQFSSSGGKGSNKLLASYQKSIGIKQTAIKRLDIQIADLQQLMNDFVARFKPNK